MTISEKVELLVRILPFSGPSREYVEELAMGASERSLSTGEILINQGELTKEAYIIVNGSVSVFLGSEEGTDVNLAVLGLGELIGEMGFFDNNLRSATVKAIQKTEVLVLPYKLVEDFLKNHPEAAIKIIELLTIRLRDLHGRIEDMATATLEKRTLRILEILSKSFVDGVIHLSQEEVAEIVGASRSRVTEVLDELEKRGQIKLGHRSIKIL